MKSMKFAEILEKKVDMTKVNLDTMKPWITKRVTELLKFEDDVVIEFIFNQLEEKHPDPKEMQINLTGFLNLRNTRTFMEELWVLLLSAMENVGGIPARFLEQKKEEIKQRQAEQERIQANLKMREAEIKEKRKKIPRRGSSRSRMRSRSPRRRRSPSPRRRRRTPPRRHSPPRRRSPSPRRRSPRRRSSPSPRNR
ncbi:hypothetical protein CAPTEDRAFT_163872, partial [Capitella teleta]